MLLLDEESQNSVSAIAFVYVVYGPRTTALIVWNVATNTAIGGGILPLMFQKTSGGMAGGISFFPTLTA